jgi:serine/threonine protein kinase
MTQCLNPDCLVQNPGGNKFCLQCGSTLLLHDRYYATQLLGEGGFGRTFAAVDSHRLNSPCVIKQFLPIQQTAIAIQKATELFKHEAVQLRNLGKHSQIPELLAFFEQEGRLYLVQQFIAGETLLKQLQRQHRFNEAEVRDLLQQLLPVLEFIHQNHVIHRDIKPDNIIRSTQGLLVLIDFGVSKQTSATLRTQLGTITGTFGYAPIEQTRGIVYPSSDLYSLGVTCIRLLTGCLPIEHNYSMIDEIFDHRQLRWIWREKLQEQGQNISPDLELVLDRLLQDIPDRRYQTAKEVLEDLKLKPGSNHHLLNQKYPPQAQATWLWEEIKRQKLQIEQEKNQREALERRIIQLESRKPSQIPLLSACGINYQSLQNLLAAGKWKEADIETAKKMVEVMGRSQEGWLRVQDFRNFPSQDLQTIDRLWVKYSRNRFGFSVQKRVYQSLGGTQKYDQKIWDCFGDRLGWRHKGLWIWSYDLNFQIFPTAHLPRDVFRCLCLWELFIVISMIRDKLNSHKLYY